MTGLCAHPGAVPVTTLDGETIAALCPDCDTGEIVAAVCADCLAALPAAWLNCPHDDTVDITSFSRPPGTEVMCAGCGGIYSPDANHERRPA